MYKEIINTWKTELNYVNVHVQILTVKRLAHDFSKYVTKMHTS